jgi:hypothetical protein
MAAPPPMPPPPDPAGFGNIPDMAAAVGGPPESGVRYMMASPFGDMPLPPDLQQLFDEAREKERGSKDQQLTNPLLLTPTAPEEPLGEPQPLPMDAMDPSKMRMQEF